MDVTDFIRTEMLKKNLKLIVFGTEVERLKVKALKTLWQLAL